MDDDCGGSAGGSSDVGPSWSASSDHHDSGHSWSSSSHHVTQTHIANNDNNYSSSHHHHHTTSRSDTNSKYDHNVAKGTVSDSSNSNSEPDNSPTRSHHHHSTNDQNVPPVLFSKARTGFYDFGNNRSSHFHSNESDNLKKDDRDDCVEVIHGFSLGTRPVSFESQTYSVNQKDNDDDDVEDEGIGEIYGTDGLEVELMRDSPSFNPSPARNRRHVISQRIGGVGHIGQNIGLGHQIGVLVEDTELRPKPVTMETREYVISEDSPMQIDVRWNKPQNSDQFKMLTYEIELKQPNSAEWSPLTLSRYPVYRVYHTDDKLLLGKSRLPQQADDVTYFLRVRSKGEVTQPDGVLHSLVSDWSKEISLTHVGYASIHEDVQITSL